MRPAHLLPAALLLIAQSACAAFDPDPRVPDRPVPSAFPSARTSTGTSTSAGELSWQEYYRDPTLTALIREAVEKNLDLAVAVQRIEIARAGVKAATGLLLPQVALGAGAGFRKFGLYTMDGAGNATTDITPGQLVPVTLPDLSLGLRASWEVDIWGRLRNMKHSAAAQYLATVEGTNLVLSSLVAEVAAAYYELLALDHTQAVLARSVTQQSRAVEVVRVQRDAGRATGLAIQQFDAQLAATRAMERELRQAAVEVENRINLLLGRYPQSVSRAKESLFARAGVDTSAGVPAHLLSNRPDVREAERLIEASSFDVAAARAAFFPNLNISAGIGFQAFNPRFLLQVPESLVYDVAGGLVAPLVNLAELEAALSGASAMQVQAVYAFQKVVLAAFVEVVDALNEVENSEALIELKQAQRMALAGAVASAEVLYAASRASYLEVLLAQEAVLRSELELIDAHRRFAFAQIALYRALGGGWR